MDARPVLDLIDAALRESPCVLVGIGGRGAAGKSRLAGMIGGAQVVCTDEFWDGEGFDIARVGGEVVEPLAGGRAARFDSYDWTARQPRGPREIEPVGVIVVEGVCALHRVLRDAYAVRVWVEASREVRLARALARDGNGSRRMWVDRWIPSEERYIARDDPIGCAHLVLENDEAEAHDAARTGSSAVGRA